jgi:hypothetical protein
MRARLVEDINFERRKDPKAAMDIGMTPERRLDALDKDLENLDISMTWHKDHTWADGFYYIVIDDDGKLSDLNLQIGYSTDEAAMAEFDSPGGFWMGDEYGSNIIDPDETSQDPKDLIMHLLKMKYNGIDQIKEDIEELKNRIDNLTKIKGFLENEG